MNKDNLLIIFVKNPELGKVKTRIAATLGEEKALAIYHYLLTYTHDIALKTKGCDRAVFYSDYIDHEDKWENGKFKKYLQKGTDLGEKMKNAFIQAFELGYKNICIIGSDNLEVNSSIIEEAFHNLTNNNAVIGPANDGGYYLLGLNKLIEEVFSNKEWSTSSVFTETIADLKRLHTPFHTLKHLNDIDTEGDWIKAKSQRQVL